MGLGSLVSSIGSGIGSLFSGGGSSIIDSLSNIGFGVYDRINQKKQQGKENFFNEYYALLDTQKFENEKNLQQWQKDVWSKEFEYNKELNDRQYDLARNAAGYRAQDLVNAGMSPLLAAGSSASTPSVVSAPSSPSISASSGRSANVSVPSVGAMNSDAFSRFAELKLNSEYIRAQANLANSQAEFSKAQANLIKDETSPGWRELEARIENLASNTSLTNTQVEKVTAEIANISADTLYKDAQRNLTDKQREKVDQEISNLKLTEDKERQLVEFCKDYGVPYTGVDGNLARAVVLGRLIAKQYSKQILTNDEHGLLEGIGYNVKDRIIQGLFDGYFDLEASLYGSGKSLFGLGRKVWNWSKFAFPKAFKSAFGGHE